MSTAIVNNRIAGTRITVYNILHYLEAGWAPGEIAEVLPLSLEQVQAAIQFIEEHRVEVMEVHRRIEERIARGNPPEIEAKLEQARARGKAWREQHLRANGQEDNGAGHSR